MGKQKKEQKFCDLTMDKRIKKVIDESWIAPVYFHSAITELLNKFNTMSDDDLVKYMNGIIHPDIARAHVKEIFNKLNPTDNETNTF